MHHFHPLVLFGEAERGNYNTAYYCDSLSQLVEYLGNPPPESQGLYFAVQALLYERNLIFFRVEEEGFSYQDYHLGLRFIERGGLIVGISAICLPGVGDAEIIEAAVPICKLHKTIMITTEPDFYD